MATTDFWTSALPVIGTIAGGVLVAITTAATTGRRDRTERLERYRVEQREAVIGVLRKFRYWHKAALNLENALRAASKSPNVVLDRYLDSYVEIEPEMDLSLAEARILITDSGLRQAFVTMPNSISTHARFIRDIAPYQLNDRVTFAEVADQCAEVRTTVLALAGQIERNASTYFAPHELVKRRPLRSLRTLLGLSKVLPNLWNPFDLRK